MDQQINQEQIINLIKYGFNLENISYEFNIPMQTLIKLQHQLNNQNEPDLDENKKTYYKKLIEKYQQEIAELSQKPNASSDELLKTVIINKKNLLAFAYFKSGQIEKSRKELLNLIEEPFKFNAYRQLIHLEHHEGNIDDAKVYAYEAIDLFPDDIGLRNQLINIATEEKDDIEVEEQLEQILRINPKDVDAKRKLYNLHLSQYERE